MNHAPKLCFAGDVSVLVSTHCDGWFKIWLTDNHIVAWGNYYRSLSVSAAVPRRSPQALRTHKLTRGEFMDAGTLPAAACAGYGARQIASSLGVDIAYLLFDRDAERVAACGFLHWPIALRAACQVISQRRADMDAEDMATALAEHVMYAWTRAADATARQGALEALRITGQPALLALASQLAMEDVLATHSPRTGVATPISRLRPGL